VDVDQLEREMAALLDLSRSGEIFTFSPFNSARPGQRRLNDIAFSGDGEPTTAKEFPEVVARLARLKEAGGLREAKLVLITDSSRLQAPEVLQGIQTLMENNGEIWAKLDAGTEAYYREINRSKIPFTRILENLLAAGRRWPITIQTLFLEWKGQGPTPGELEAYKACLRVLLEGGATLQGLQLYTVARPTPEAAARPLNSESLDLLAAEISGAFPQIPVEVFYGPDGGAHA
jgi:wyosine [tRNA(Phe)-imidazoG37] synthetase (radical SAM superfamily)